MGKIKTVLTKEDANKALDNINMWINNCDTKSSIALGFYATIITIILSTEFVDIQKGIIAFFFDNINVLSVLYLVFHFSAIFFFIVGVIELLRVTIPKIILGTDNDKIFDSVLFYGVIAKNTPKYDDYCKKVEEATDEIIMGDLLFQVHSAALICERKFRHHKIGIFLTTISIVVFLVTTVIGIVVS